MKKLVTLFFTLLLLSACGANGKDDSNLHPADSYQASMVGQSNEPIYESEVDYKKMQAMLSELNKEMNQPNILKDDVLRGWYLGQKDEKKYGTPKDWIWIDDGENSKWVSPNSVEEVEIVDDRELCKDTAGTYKISCLDTTDSDCEYVPESYCHCSYLSKWKDHQGCILVNEDGLYVAINSQELERGWYHGLPSQKKLNTPSNWIWIEAGRDSIWSKP